MTRASKHSPVFEFHEGEADSGRTKNPDQEHTLDTGAPILLERTVFVHDFDPSALKFDSTVLYSTYCKGAELTGLEVILEMVSWSISTGGLHR